MKVRDSGMPEESVWSGFFTPESILASFGLDGETKDVVEFGCGYGTFTLPTARLIEGIVFTFDVEPDMVATVCEKSGREGIWNVVAEQRDFVAEGTGLPNDFAEAVLLFNILHHHEPVALMGSFRVLQPGGRAAASLELRETTPRGPSMDFRRAEQCITWGEQAGFIFFPHERYDFRPYHYGLLFRKPL